MIHQLKIREEYYNNILNNKKKFEVRFNDRDYQVGDKIQFTKAVTNDGYENSIFTPTKYLIVYIHTGLGLLENYVVLGLEEIK